MERTAMSSKEFTRTSVLARVEARTITLTEAVPLLGVSYRQAKRLYRRYREQGAKGLVHGNVGRRSNHAHVESEREQVLSLIREHYGGSVARGAGQRFGPTLVAEHLWMDHGVLVARSTLRDWMRESGLWSRMRKSKAPTHVRRERMPHFGELVQMDGSFHDWFEGRGPRAGRRSCMMSLVDDATSTTLLRFGDEETIWAAVGVLRAWITQYGVPRSLYTDWKNVYKREPTTNERAQGEEALTQFGRMCKKLGIEIIGAKSPQAKGRIERNHETQQDRLVKKMRLLGIGDDVAANEYVTGDYLPRHNLKFAVVAASTVDYHRPWDRRVREDDVFCLEHRRVVGNDYVVQYKNQALQLDRAARGRVPAKSTVLVRETEGGRPRVIHTSRDGRDRVCAWTPAVKRTMVQPAAEISEESLLPSSPSNPKAPHKPGPDHPWRRQHKEWRELALLRRAAPMHTHEL